MTKTAVYLRISLDQTGEGLAVERQRQDALKLAKTKNWAIHDIYEDNSVSASKVNVVRPNYRRMLEDYRAGMFDAVICYDLDRLTRQPRELEDWIDEAEHKGLKLVTLNGEADLTTDGGRMYARIKLAVAKGEVERKSVRQKRASLQRSQMGKPAMGPRLTGYDSKGKIIKDEAATVERIFELFNAGTPLKDIARKLNKDAVDTRHGGTWSPSSISTILRNPRYAGWQIYNGERTGDLGRWKPIIKQDQWALAQSKLDDPSRKKNGEGTARKYLGSNIYLCGVCLKPIRSNGARYWCPEGGHVTRSSAPIDDAVLKVIRDRLAEPDAASLLAVDTGKTSELLAKVEASRARLAQIDSDYDEGLIDGKRHAVASQKVKDSMIADLRAVVALAGNSALSQVIAGPDPVAAFDAAPLGVQRSIIDALLWVRVLPAPRGIRGFDPKTVLIYWKQTNVMEDGQHVHPIPPTVKKALGASS